MVLGIAGCVLFGCFSGCLVLVRSLRFSGYFGSFLLSLPVSCLFGVLCILRFSGCLVILLILVVFLLI